MMKKRLFTLIALMTLGVVSFGQIEIHYDGEVVESPSSEVTGDVGGGVYFQGYYIVNVSGATVELDWSRHNLSGGNCLDDQVCTDESCYTPFGGGLVFNAPETAEIAPGDSTYFKVGGSADANCCAIFRYYLRTGLGTLHDSIDVKYRIGDIDCFLSVEKEEKVEISAFPNPANALFNISLANVANGNHSVQIFNVVGERVLVKNLVNGQNSLNIESLPSGVYFYSILNGSQTVETKKLVVRH